LRLVDRIDWTGFVKNPKWLVGYSDMTVFHSHLYKNTNVASLHATMPINFFRSQQATETLFSALCGQSPEYRFSAAESKNARAVEAPVVGGNLSLLYALQGSASDIDTHGTILFLEDLDEYLYHIDRMMIALKRSGKLAGLKALLIGGFTDMKDNAVPFGSTAHEIILDAVKEYDYPVYFHFPAGHQDDNRAILLGMPARLEPSGDQIIFRQ
jgi:muramoyltetrapeptide carboxypeptidase